MEGVVTPGPDLNEILEEHEEDWRILLASDHRRDDYLVIPYAFSTKKFLGLEFAELDQVGVFECISSWITLKKFKYVVTPNVAHVVSLDRESAHRPEIVDAYAAADLTICDSRILASLTAWSGIEIPVVTGSDLTARLLTSKGPWSRIAVVGGLPEMHRRLETMFPQYEWHFHVPPYGLLDDRPARERIASFVEEKGADLTFFAFGAPQSELCCHEIARRGRASTVVLCTGASLEFLTSMKKRAPVWFQRNRLEWLYRLLSDPSRLWRRYLIECPRIFAIWLRERSNARKKAASARA